MIFLNSIFPLIKRKIIFSNYWSKGIMEGWWKILE